MHNLSVDLPHWKTLFWPTLEALTQLGGSGAIQEIEAKVAELLDLSEAHQAVIHKDGPYTELNYRLSWCRTYLKGVGALTNTGHGLWAITEKGRQMTEQDMASIASQYKAIKAAAAFDQPVLTMANGAAIAGAEDHDEAASNGTTWKDVLLQTILALPADRFEHLAKRLLREAGFVQVSVTGKVGDEGIDGTGIYRQALVSFPVFFQCKRYKGTVGASTVREFRGAIQGRGEKGLLITTGAFTAQARHEASRAGASLIDLIDGDTLADLLKQFRLGVHVDQRIVEDVSVRPEFFETV